MIYSDTLEKLDFMKYDPEKCRSTLLEIEDDVKRLWRDFNNVWEYCVGCKGYTRKTEVYESTSDTLVPDLDNVVMEVHRNVLRCCNCHTIRRYLD